MSTKVTYTNTYTDSSILFASMLNENFDDIKNFCEKSNDATLATASATAMPTEYAVKTYVDTKVLTLTPTSISMAGNFTLNEYGIILDTALSADGKYSGIVTAGTAGATLAFGDLCYLAVADSRWELTDADAESTAFGVLGICVLAAAADGDATTMLLLGAVRADTAFPALTIGAPVFISTDAGDITNTAPSGSGDIVRCLGHAITADSIFFRPDGLFIELA